jgi:K+-transporting ATPase ATPase C chain
MKQNLIPALRMTAAMLVLCSVLYTLVVLGFAKAVTPTGGSVALVTREGNAIGAANVGQAFSDDRYFHGRASAVDYDGAGSGGSNHGPTNPDHLADVQARIDSFMLHNPGVSKADIPSELVTASGSGLDPDISPGGARIQAKRIAQARMISEDAVLTLIDKHTHGPLLGLFGPSTVNILELNLALDALQH